MKDKSTKKKRVSNFPIINLNAAGIDIADKRIDVCVPSDRDDYFIRTFGAFTCDLNAIADYLKKCNIDTVAMESTGVYWIALFLILQEKGFDVYLVNAKHVKNVTGRKKDEEDVEWIQRLHSCGLLKRSFQPDNDIRELRSLVRHRKNLIKSQSSHVNRIIKTLELMNIKLHTVISDILGKSGMSILKAIIENGERDPEKLSKLTHKSIKASKEEIIKSLEADWREEHLFELKQYYEFYFYYKKQIEEVEVQIEKRLQKTIIKNINPDIDIKDLQKETRKTRKLKKNEFSYDIGKYLKIISGVDLTKIFGINDITALEIISECGTDMNRFPSSKNFCSWLGLAPNNKISGGKILSSKVPKKKHNAGQAFRIAANSLWRSQNEFGDHYRRIKSRDGASKAIVATARKIATVFYTMILKNEEFNTEKLTEYYEIYKEKKIKRLERQLAYLKAG